jgi:hypothetical protein
MDYHYHGNDQKTATAAADRSRDITAVASRLL